MRLASLYLTPAPRTTPDEWAKANRRYKSSAGVPGPRDPGLTGYMIPLSRKVHEANYRRVIGVTAAQSGKTDTILDVIGARLDQRPAPILYAGPSNDFVRDQFEPRLMELLDQAPVLGAKVVRGRRMKKSLKTIAGVRVRLGSAASSTSLKSDPFALGIVDEYDEMVANIKGQGDPLGLVEARGETYADFSTVVVSTPSRGIAETEIDEVSGLEFWKVGDQAQIESPIWRIWQQGTRHHFAWPCPHCGEYFVPMFKHLKWPKGSTPAMARKSAYLLCPSGNGCVIEEGPEGSTKRDMIARGVHIAPGQTIEDAFAERNVPESNAWSCWTSGLCSPFVTWGESAERYLAALMTGEEDKIQTVMNARFGELYTPGTSGGLPEWKVVLQKRIGYPREMAPPGVLRVVAGVDVQKKSLVYVIRGFGSRGTSWLIDHGVLLGNTGELEVWNDLAMKMSTPIGGMIIERVFVDSGFRPEKTDGGDEHMVYSWVKRHEWMAFATKGRDTIAGKPYSVSQIEVRQDGTKLPYSLPLVLLNTDFFKSLVHSRLNTAADQPGAFFLHNEADEDYARQLISEVRVIGDKLKPEWVKRQKANHFLDCEALAAAAAYSLNVQAIPEGVERTWNVPNEESGADKAPAPEKELVPAGGSPTTSIRDRFRNLGARAHRR